MTRPGAQVPVERGEAYQHRPRVGDCVHTEVGPRPVRGEALDLDRERGEPSVRDHEPLVGGLGDDGRVGAMRASDGLRAHAGELLVRDRRDDDVAPEPGRDARAAASMDAARLPFMSPAPRP